MATIVDLYIGLDCSGIGPSPVSYDLVLTSPYYEPSPYLLVLRSRPDVDPIIGTLSATSSADTATFTGTSQSAIDPITGVFNVISQNDTSGFVGTAVYPAITGTLSATSQNDTASISGTNSGLVPILGYMTATNAADTATFEGSYSHTTTGVVSAISINDYSVVQGAFYAYEGPGYLVSDGRPDIATWEGTNVYDVSGTLLAVDEPDISTWLVTTRIILEAESLTDTVLASDELLGATSNTALVDIVLATDILEESLDGDFRDTLLAADSLVTALQVSYPLTDVVNATDGLYGLTFGVTVDTVLATDALTSNFIQAELDDIAVATDTLISYINITGILADTGVVTEALDAIRLAPVADTVLAADTLTSILEQFPSTLTDTVTATDVLTGPLTVYANLTDTGTATDTLLGGLTLVGVLADTVLAGDSLHEAAQTVYVVNAETGAVSTYVFTPVITGMAEYQGVLYLSGPDGLYALDATEDDTGSVVWTLRTGFSNLGTDKLKRIQDCNMQLRTEGDTTFQVVTDRYGAKEEWNYRITPASSRSSYRDGVVKVGRGIQSVYLQFAAQGVGPAEIDQLRLVVEPLYRRR